MGFTNIDTSAAQEPTLASAGEHKLRITGYFTDQDGNVIKTDKNGNNYFSPVFELVDDPMAKELNDFIPLPHDNMSAKQKNDAAWKIACFEKCFGIEEIDDPDATIGEEGFAMLMIKMDTYAGEEVNKIKTYM